MNAVPPAPTFHWRQAALAILLVQLALLALYFGTASAMVEIWWRSETFNHAFLVPPIALWLIWQKREVLARIAPVPAPWLLAPLAAIAFGWLLGDLVAVNVVTQFALVAMLVLAVPLVIGLPAARRIAFPLGFLFFAVPFGEFAMPKLMDWTALFTVMGLRASGIPVYQEGLHFVIPSGRWSVVEACSGVRYLIASVVVGTLYAYLNYRSLKRRLIFVGFSILVPLVANWLRAYMIVMLGHYSDNTLAVGVDHLIYGWIFFGVVMMILFMIGMRWREDVDGAPPQEAGSPVPAAARPAGFVLAALAAASIASAPHAALALLEEDAPPLPALAAAPLAAGGWQLVDAGLSRWRPAFENPAATLDVALEKEGRRVGVFVAYYRQQGYEREMISSTNVLVRSGDEAWAVAGRGQAQAVLGGQRVTLNTATLRSKGAVLGDDGASRLRVWHAYWIDGRIVASDPVGKLWLAFGRLRGRGDDAAAIFIAAAQTDGDALLTDYLATAGPALAALLAQTAAARQER